jgi:hypothetical protein
MRMQIELDDELVAQIDELSGPRVVAHSCVRPSSVQFVKSSAGPTWKPPPVPSQPVLDSTVLIDFLRDDQRLDASLRHARAVTCRQRRLSTSRRLCGDCGGKDSQ